MPLSDCRRVRGQVLNDVFEFAGDIPCAFFDRFVEEGRAAPPDLSEVDVILAFCVHEAALTRGEWPIVDNRRPILPRDRWPNAQFRYSGSSWIGAKFYDAGIAEESKNGPTARMTSGQKELQQTLESGGQVTPVGKRAREADLTPGKPTKATFREERHNQ